MNPLKMQPRTNGTVINFAQPTPFSIQLMGNTITRYLFPTLGFIAFLVVVR
jgi:hypothetical protein